MSYVVRTASIPSPRGKTGLLVRVEVNTQTGSITVSDFQNGDVIAYSGEGADWEMPNPRHAASIWNRRVEFNAGLTPEEAEQAFFTNDPNQGKNVLNNVRADILNDDSNYPSSKEANNRQEEFFDQRIPGIIDPKSGRKVTNDGRTTAHQTEGTDDDISIDNGSSTPTGDTTNSSISLLTHAKTETLRYPEKFEDASNMDYVRMTAYDYVPSFSFNGGLGGGGTSGGVASRPGERGARFTNPKETIYLPMQPNLSSTNSVSYKEDELNPLQLAGGEGLSAGLRGQMPQAFRNLITEAGAEAVQMYYTGKAIGKSVLTRTKGNVINNNLELLFNGPRMRIFNFTFRLTPRTETEGKTIRKMIKSLKRNMSPQRSDAHIFLKSPRVFQLQYLYNNGSGYEDHPYLHQFKPCVLSNLVSNFTPDGSYSTYENGSMSQYELTMVFEEIEPVFEDEYDGKDDMGL